MKKEFKRFQLEKLGLVVIILQCIGATGLLVGLQYKPILMISSCGLAFMMLLGVVVRIRLRDALWICLPALFYMVLNAYIFYVVITQPTL